MLMKGLDKPLTMPPLGKNSSNSHDIKGSYVLTLFSTYSTTTSNSTFKARQEEAELVGFRCAWWRRRRDFLFVVYCKERERAISGQETRDPRAGLLDETHSRGYVKHCNVTYIEFEWFTAPSACCNQLYWIVSSSFVKQKLYVTRSCGFL